MISSLSRFMVIGNGGGGTSLLRGLLNAHPDIECLFEHNKGGKHRPAENEIKRWIELSQESDKIWGNKVPYEQFLSRSWTDKDFLDLIEHFKIIWLIRRFSRYWKGKSKGTYEKNWHEAQRIYWLLREAYPDRIIQVSFEDLLLRTTVELRRICNFLNVTYEANMLKGTMDTGLGSYDQKGINLDKL